MTDGELRCHQLWEISESSMGWEGEEIRASGSDGGEQ